MGIVEMLISKAAPTFGKSPQELQQAIEKGKKIVQDAPSSVEGARKIMQENGIPTSFLDKAANIVAPFSSVLGIKKENILNDINAIKGTTRPTQQDRARDLARQRSSGSNNFKSKFPKV